MQSNDAVQTTLMRASARAWGIATGLVLGVGLFVATLWLVIKGGPDAGSHLGRLGQVFPGYDVTVRGSFIGLVYAFVVGYALGRLLAPRQLLSLAERAAEREKHVRLNGRSWGLATGGVLAVILFAATTILALRGGENVGDLLRHLAVYFPGYSVSVGGALIGAGYALALGLLLGRGIAAIYNATVVRAEDRIARS